MIQDVAFGTKTMKLGSGERIIIPAVIRTVIPSRIIQQYTSYCKQQDFVPASERSRFRMLDVCSASMKKSLQGLDNLTAEGPKPQIVFVWKINVLRKSILKVRLQSALHQVQLFGYCDELSVTAF